MQCPEDGMGGVHVQPLIRIFLPLMRVNFVC